MGEDIPQAAVAVYVAIVLQSVSAVAFVSIAASLVTSVLLFYRAVHMTSKHILRELPAPVKMPSNPLV